MNREIEEALDLLDVLQQHAYQYGFHECGYDPVKRLRKAFAQPDCLRESGNHTKGPWHVKGNCVYGTEVGEIICSCSLAPDETRQAANANLIAAAPDLLSALEDVCANAASDSPAMWWGRAMDAIKKAKGE